MASTRSSRGKGRHVPDPHGHQDLSEVRFYTPFDTRRRLLRGPRAVHPRSVTEASTDPEQFSGTVSAEQVDQFDDVDIIVTYGDQARGTRSTPTRSCRRSPPSSTARSSLLPDARWAGGEPHPAGHLLGARRLRHHARRGSWTRHVTARFPHPTRGVAVVRRPGRVRCCGCWWSSRSWSAHGRLGRGRLARRGLVRHRRGAARIVGRHRPGRGDQADPAHGPGRCCRRRARPLRGGHAGRHPQPAGRSRRPRGHQRGVARRGRRDRLFRAVLADRPRLDGHRRGVPRRPSFVYAVGSVGRGGPTPLKLALAGAATRPRSPRSSPPSSCPAATSPRRPVWEIGGVGGATRRHRHLVLPFLVVGSLVCMLSARSLNSLALGDELAAGLGERVALARAWPPSARSCSAAPPPPSPGPSASSGWSSRTCAGCWSASTTAGCCRSRTLRRDPADAAPTWSAASWPGRPSSTSASSPRWSARRSSSPSSAGRRLRPAAAVLVCPPSTVDAIARGGVRRAARWRLVVVVLVRPRRLAVRRRR